MRSPIYLDYAATTPVDPSVADLMSQYLTSQGIFGNPSSSTHRFGRLAAEAVAIARAHVAALIGADPGEIIAGANRYAVSVAGKESGFIKHPQGWLTDGRWSDEVSTQPVHQQSEGGERRSFLRKVAGAA